MYAAGSGVPSVALNVYLCWTAYDLATQCPSRRSMRRHTIMICEPVPGVAPAAVKVKDPVAESPLADACDLATSTLGLQLPELSWSRNSLQEDLFHSVSPLRSPPTSSQHLSPKRHSA